MTRRYHQYLTIEQAARALNIDVNQVLAMLNSGQLRRSPSRPGTADMVNSTDIELTKQRLETLRRLDGDVQQ
ncbi:helix-turn-helix domain-containing protein [Pseudarthrobacter sp. NS4]|uniref:helix-turn-helix domain-containing protein n=1 Tax=Pseudarthrobacter sp. NS4 TaxID=2973976 RepID=UPI0021639C3B|nr:helix-turn-helix domain-containing protein [Pseudarthrobacter sp. NS4]